MSETLQRETAAREAEGTAASGEAKKPGWGRRLLGVLLVAALLVFGLVVTSMIVVPKSNNSHMGLGDTTSSGLPAEPDDTIDVLFVGDSLALWGFLPVNMYREYGFASYVCATVGQVMPDGYVMLRNAFSHQHPRVVAIEVHDVFTSFTWDKALMVEAEHRFPVFKYHIRWMSLTPEDVTTCPKRDWIDIDKGGLASSDVVAANDEGYMIEEQVDDNEATGKIELQNELYLKRMIQYCKEQGATPLLVSVPSVVGWNVARHDAIAAWADAHDIPYYDYNLHADEIGINWETDSRDGGDHLNGMGAGKLSTYVARMLDDQFDLPDHRGDPAYYTWE